MGSNCQCQRSFLASTSCPSCLPHENEQDWMGGAGSHPRSHKASNESSCNQLTDGEGAAPAPDPAPAPEPACRWHLPCTDTSESGGVAPLAWTSSFQRSWPLVTAKVWTTLSVDDLEAKCDTSAAKKGQQAPGIGPEATGRKSIDGAKEVVKASPEEAPAAEQPEEYDSDKEYASDIESQIEPQAYEKGSKALGRRASVVAEPFEAGFYFREPHWNKHEAWEFMLFNMLQGCRAFRQYSAGELYGFVCAMEIHKRYAGEYFCREGDLGDGLFAIVEGTIDLIRKDAVISSVGEGVIVDEHNVLWNTPRKYSMKARNECTVAFFRRTDYMNLSVRAEFYKRGKLHGWLRSSPLLEMMPDESIAGLVDVLVPRSYEKDTQLITQGEAGHELFIMVEGETKVEISTGDERQEYNTLRSGDLFGENALASNQPRRAHITAVTQVEVLVLTRHKFMRLLGNMAALQKAQYQTDPRSLIAEFYQAGNTNGPRGALKLAGLDVDPSLGETHWFVIYRPTSKDAIAKMLSGNAVGKGLNVKGKSAKQGVLSGFVPFVQISDNAHKKAIEKSPPEARTKIYYRNKSLAREAIQAFEKALQVVGPEVKMANTAITTLDDYEPNVYGIEVPEALMREVYIMTQDLSPMMGWETGRRSEPGLMDANLHSIRDGVEPTIVLYQNDEGNAMNPRGLLVAYAETYVKPVVSDFDTFLVGSKGFEYEKLPAEQCKLINWTLEETLTIMKSGDDRPWMTKWFEVIGRAPSRGVMTKPKSKFGFGDPTSLRLIEAVVAQTSPCGAVRHGAESANLFFPQPMDDDYLIVYHAFPEKPWKNVGEPELRQFLLDRVNDGYSFPLNPVWPVRDDGWYSVLQALRDSEAGMKSLNSFFPPEAGILKLIDDAVKELEGLKLLKPHG